jgi:copper chaperone NosL
MKRATLAIIFMLAFLLLAGCGQSANTDEPPEIAYGQDVCDRCGMIISEEKFAAAYWTEAGEARRFDDIGGMLAYITEESEDAASYWVHDFAGGEWIRAEEAFYLLDSELMTPMGFGIAAFANEDQALAMAQGREDAAIVRFAQLLEKQISLPADIHSHEQDGG